jgi:aconitase B
MVGKKKKAKARPSVSLEKQIEQKQKQLEELRKLNADNQAREAAMVEELANLKAQVIAAAVPPAVEPVV